MVPPTNSPLGVNKVISRPSSIAGSEFFDSTEENNNQRAADAHLAQSMRTRSVNLLDRVNSNNNNIGNNQNGDLLVTPSRDRGLNSNNLIGGSGGGGGINSAQRRGSVGNSNNKRDHLADDLMQDQGYYVDRNRNQQQQTQRPLNPQHPFYRHQRNLSDSSLDGFVDHRRPPVHSLASGGGNRGIMISGGERNLPESNYGIRTSNRTPGLRRESSGEVLGTRRSRSRSVSPSSRNLLQDPSLSIITVRNSTTRQGLTSQDLDENAIISDNDDHLEERQSPRAYIERHISQTSNRSDHDRLHEDDLIGGFSNELSRRGSSLGKPEEDVCFPSHGAVDPDLLDLGLSSMYGHSGMGGGIGGGGGGIGGDQQDNDHLHLHQHQHHHNGVAGVLQNFPFPFDFGALEEFAEREKEGMPIPAAKKRGGANNAPPEYGNSSSGGIGGGGGSKMRNRLGASANSGGEEDLTGSRRTMRQRKLSESVAPGRFQRKLAIFEGEGEEGPSEPRGERGSGGAGSSTWTSILDAKTPLMGGGGSGGGGTNNAAKPRGGYGATNGPGITSANAAARPYRFSFYSNALPSTIHARSLAEIPAEGQTFEELFVGHQTNEYEDESQSQSQTGGNGNNNNNTDPRMAFSPASQSNTGANTPNGPNSHSNQPSLSGHQQQQNSARPGGIPQPSGGGMREKVRNARMRTEMDTEANTWWLDVLCPTDQEMKVLSKVCSFSLYVLDQSSSNYLCFAL